MKYVRSRGILHRTSRCQCGQEVCMRCGAAAHGWVRCANVGDDEFNRWARNNADIKPCPKCKIKTWKYTGCNHMTCQKCRHEWCWICFGATDVPGGHFSGIVFFCPGGQFGSSNTCFTLIKLILLIIFTPVILLLGPIVIGFGYPFIIFCESDCNFFVNLILWILAEPFSLALGTLVGALAFTLITIPMEITQIIRLCRLLMWKIGCNCCMPCCWM